MDNMQLLEKEHTITSLEVAEMVEKQHNELLKDIRRYVEQLGEGKIPICTNLIILPYEVIFWYH